MPIKLDVQKLEPGQRVRLVEVDCTEFNGPVMHFHNYNVEYTQAELLAAQTAGTELTPKKITWKGQAYDCWPYDIDGIELDGTGSTASPNLTVANVDSTISSLCLALNDLAQAKVTIHITFQHYLDGEPGADPTQEFTQVWYIDRKTNEDNVSISWSLSNPADTTGKLIPARQIHGICYWMLQGQYRGADCGYTGTAYFDADGNSVANPALDRPSGLLSTCCKVRFGASNPLPFGGFPASALMN
jgi:lambda family phage minor tail protein L